MPFTTIKNGIHRPLSMGIQLALKLDPDGYFGPITEEQLKVFQYNRGIAETGVVDQETLTAIIAEDPILEFRILEVISCFECGWDTHNVWAYTSVVEGDGGGTNYGAMQVNQLGSAQTIQKRYMPAGENFEDWIGTGSGAKAQGQYFLDLIYPAALKFAYSINDTSDRTVAMLCDAIVQGGQAYPTKTPKSYDDWRLESSALKMVKDNYSKYGVQEAFFKSVTNYEVPGKMYAELHPRSGNPQFLSIQLARRRTVFDGTGKVYGEKYDLSELGF